MGVEVRRLHRGAGPAPAPAGAPSEFAAGVGITDAFEAGGVRRTKRAVSAKPKPITGPYEILAQGGDFSRTVLTPSGEFFVSVRLAKKNPGQERPLVYLDGIAARRSRSDMMADKLRDDGGRTVISILLKGQGETLLRDLEKTKGKSLASDISDAEQAKVVLDVLDTLGVDHPVDVFGLSYGGAIAAAIARDAKDRVAQVLLAAPHVRSQARDYMGEAAWKLANSP